MKRLDRYIVREMMVPFLIGTVAVVLMFQANILIAQGKEVRLNDVPLSAIFQMVLFRTPQFLSMTLPVGVALASSLAISRLSRESELTAMRSAGVSILRVVIPVAAFGAAVAFLNYYLVDRVMPKSEAHANRLWQEVIVKAAAPTFKSNVMISLSNYSVSVGSIQRGVGSQILLDRIMLIERPRPDETIITESRKGSYTDGVWVLKEPYVRVIKGDTLIDARAKADLVINEPIRVQDFFSPPQPTEMTSESLRKAIAEGRHQKIDTTNLELAYQIKFSVPAACLVFAFTGPVFAVWLARSGPFVGVLLSIFMVLIYYNAFVISTEVLGRNGLLSPVAAAWLPNVLFLVLGLVALRRAE